ncbi:MAG: hypothetical protein A3K65_03800 [Euryarchaeota archaeon RBG_16_68_12]|nr:MAG: hypothetical protein A3K65_03800 [Euryarchaeota archaeon RBG_16_68_12]
MAWQASRWLVREVVREVLFILICVAGAWLFLNHGILYLRGDPLPAISGEAYVLTTVVLYLFVRSLALVAGGRAFPARDEVRCPECGAPVRTGDVPNPGPPAKVSAPDPVDPRVPASTRIVRRAWRPPWMAER